MQKTVSLSTAEAEYFQALEMAIEIFQLHNLLENMGFIPTPDTQVYEDNTKCINLGNQVIGEREWQAYRHSKAHRFHTRNYPEPQDAPA